MQLKFSLKHGSYINDLCLDSKKNLWLSSPKGEGLILYRAESIINDSLNQPNNTVPNLSVVKQQNGQLLVGNSIGEILEINPKIKKHVLFNASNTALIRHIIISQNKVFSFGENGILVNYSKLIAHRNNKCKNAYALNHSLWV
jgi:ligand-binding sensor domain-containing protein